MEFVKTVIYMLLTAVMELAIVFFPDSAPFASGFYMSILSAYLGLDVWAMIQKTASLPKGEYGKIKSYRYVVCVAGYAVLIATGCVMRKLKGYEYDGMFRTFISAIFIIGAVYMGALEGNKIATPVDGGEAGK